MCGGYVGIMSGDRGKESLAMKIKLGTIYISIWVMHFLFVDAFLNVLNYTIQSCRFMVGCLCKVLCYNIKGSIQLKIKKCKTCRYSKILKSIKIQS